MCGKQHKSRLTSVLTLEKNRAPRSLIDEKKVRWPGAGGFLLSIVVSADSLIPRHSPSLGAARCLLLGRRRNFGRVDQLEEAFNRGHDALSVATGHDSRVEEPKHARDGSRKGEKRRASLGVVEHSQDRLRGVDCVRVGELLSAVGRAEVNVGEDGASANCAGDGILENVLLARFVTISSSQQAGDSCRDEERAAISRLVVSGWIDTAIGRRGMLYRVVRCKLVQ